MFVHAIDLNPESWMSFFKLGYLSQNEGQRLRDDADKKSLLRLEVVQERQRAKGVATAAEFCAEAAALNPNSVIGYHNYAVTLMYFRSVPRPPTARRR